MMSRILLAAGAVLTLAACSAPASPAGVAASGGTLTHPGDLRNYLLATPASATEENPGIGTDGSVTLDQDAAADGTPSKRSDTLKRYHFKAEAVRAWKGGDGSDIEIVLIQFDTPADAFAYESVEANYAEGFTQWKVPQVPTGLIYVDPGSSTATTAAVEGVVSEGDTAVLVFSDEPLPGAPTIVTPLLTSQFTKLAAPPASPAA
jgi:hypothetical protein